MPALFLASDKLLNILILVHDWPLYRSLRFVSLFLCRVEGLFVFTYLSAVGHGYGSFVLSFGCGSWLWVFSLHVIAIFTTKADKL